MTKGKRAASTVTTVDGLKADPANRRTHNARNIEMIATALRSVGASRSIVIDEHDEELAGNGVVRAAAQAGISKVQIVDVDGDTIVAVRRTGLTPEQKRDLAIYDNRTAELAAWDIDQLRADVNAGLDLQPFFFEGELAALFSGAAAKPGLTDPDVVPPERPTGIVAGDLFELGRHRLLCGDSTAQGDVARLLGALVPFLMVTDPPYGVDYEPDWRNHAYRADGTAIGGKRTGQVTNDDRVDWTPAWALFPGDVAYVWHASLFGGDVSASLSRSRFEVRSQIIWKKPRFAISRGHYHWQHEACLYAFRTGRPAKWVGGRAQATVWDIALTDDTGQTNHGTQKPVECMRRPIANHGGPTDAVYEPFSGSGSTLIAAEQLERPCVAIEIDPVYVQMAIDRWEAFTGQRATKVGAA